MSKVTVIGAGISGLSAACFAAKYGHDVTVIEKNNEIGGRARQFAEKGFTFDMGPSWYWMPDIFEDFYNKFGYTTSDFYELKRLDPSYKIFWQDKTSTDILANFEKLKELFESIEKGAGEKLDEFLNEAKIKYEIGMNEFVKKPSISMTEYFDLRILKQALKIDLFSSITSSINKLFDNSKIKEILEFPVLFLGAKPEKTPALYSLMNYADIKLGTWFPIGGMYKIIEAFERIAKENGVKFELGQSVQNVDYHNKNITKVITNSNEYETDYVINSADYHYFEQKVLPKRLRTYSDKYWETRVFAPSCILFYLGVDKKIPNLEHHNLFFDADFNIHAENIYDNHEWPEKPLFYVSATSKTDETAPEGMENLFVLIPVSVEKQENNEIVDSYFNQVISRIEEKTGTFIKDSIVYKKTFTRKDFIDSYNSYKGNAYGLANTLLQTAFLKPKLKTNKINNLFNVGQLTVPGPGVPPSIISGQIAANLIKGK